MTSPDSTAPDADVPGEVAELSGDGPRRSRARPPRADADPARGRRKPGQRPRADHQAGTVFKGEEELVRLLVQAGADPHAGQPSAVDSARMFGRTGYLEMFGVSEQK